jgi:voltage-gated potassium channel
LKDFKTILQSKQNSTVQTLNVLIIIASVILILSTSLEIFKPSSFSAISLYFEIQFWICIFFTVSFFIFLFYAEKKWLFLAKYSFLLLLSIPYLTIFNYASIQLSTEQSYLISFIPIIRGSVALVILLFILVQKHTTALFISYLVLLFAIIYFLSLIFFIFERNVNVLVSTYPDALWWAGMTVTTVGSNIVPMTSVGKISTTVLAATGMTSFPIFTVYFTTVMNRVIHAEKTIINHNHKKK